MLPIATVDLEKETHVIVRFKAELIEEDIKFDTDEILDVKWIDIEEIKHMEQSEVRAYELNINTIDCIEQNKIYPLELFDDKKYDK